LVTEAHVCKQLAQGLSVQGPKNGRKLGLLLS